MDWNTYVQSALIVSDDTTQCQITTGDLTTGGNTLEVSCSESAVMEFFTSGEGRKEVLIYPNETPIRISIEYLQRLIDSANRNLMVIDD